jgi:hypothetical protein
MMAITGFEPSKPFFDDKNFPRGFSKSGEFTINEANILTTYGAQLKALQDGIVAPSTNEQKRFLLAISGEVPVETPLEKAWLRYCDKVNRPRRMVSAFGSTIVAEEADSEDDAELDSIDGEL